MKLMMSFGSSSKLKKYYNQKLINRVIIELKDVHTLSKENINCLFNEKSFEICFKNLKGKHYKFGVPNLQCKIDPKSSKFLVKQDKILISLKKIKKEDRWISLFKTKTIGGDDD